MRCWAVIIVEQSTNTYSTLYMKIILLLLHSSSYLAIIAICTQVFNIPQIKYYILIVGLQV